jgi:hypothetical protein
MEAAKAMGLPYDAARAELDLESLDKLDRQIEWYEIAIAQANHRKEEIRGRLMDFGISFRQTVGRSRLSLANGSLVILKRRERIDITDATAFREWCIANNYIKSVADESGAKQVIVWTPTGDGVHGAGEIVPGIKKFLPGDYDFSVKIEVGEKKIFDKEEEEIDPKPVSSADDETKRQRILGRALAVLEPLGAGSTRYNWAMDKIFGSHDWNVVKGFSLKKLDADTRGRIARIIGEALLRTERGDSYSVDDPIESIIGEETIPSKVEIERISADLRAGKTPANAIRANLVAAIRTYIENLPEGSARWTAMTNAFGSTDWNELEAYSLQEIEEVVEGGRLTRIVEDAMKGTK